MRAIIPVAGFGSRLKPHTYSIPKVLLNVGGKPIIGHIIDKILGENINKATFVIGHLGEMIRDYVTDTYPELKADFVEQREMQGLGHAIYTAVPTFDEKEIFIILGDTIFDVDLKDVLRNKQTALGVKTVEDPSRFGVAVCENGRIVKLVEKPKTLVSKLALVGLYYISDAEKLVNALNELIRRDIRTKGELQLTDALQIMIESGEDIATFPVEGWYDCGKPETLLSTNQFILERDATGHNIKSVVINEPVFIAPSAVVKNSVIGPYATISEGCTITDSIIKNSIVGSGATVKCAMLDHSLIGNSSQVKGNYQRLNAGDSSEIEFF
ncbi:MAG: NTP transferase domain-containing protein [Ignavibacteria bacterium]|jgi:glucose-1-phosphate thymidylyltransferase|nr:NTP transferase domain-containing protein [Ignavibacteria bacterium]MCU7503237.1 NTP transferase domain-containing protein [Ignavibacteria bacterium]MCU7517306.1 NTP transferase domain-containing protein [Ignavibacteria bacterium]